MNRREVLDNPDNQRRPEDLDGLLRAYFRAELPQPWPHLQRPLEAPALPVVAWRRTLVRSRWALAAALLGLVTGSLYLSGRFVEPLAGEPAGGKDAARRLPHLKPRGVRAESRLEKNLAPLEDDDEMLR
jgi:hypothetical protein